MLHLTLASWRRHRRRYVATFLAVFLGVGFCAATLALTASARQGAQDAVALPYSKADVVAFPANVRSAGAEAERITRVGGVEVAAGIGTSFADVRWSVGQPTSSGRITEVPGPAALRWQQLDTGHFPHAVHQVAVDASLAAANHVTVGNDLLLAAAGGERRIVSVVGLFTPTHGSAGDVAVWVSPNALQALGFQVAAAEIDVRGTPGSSTASLQQAVKRAVPSASIVSTAQLRQQAVSDLTNKVDVIGRFLVGFAFVALFVAGLVIANTFRIVMAQRIRELALLRCLGAQRGQLFAMSLGEAGLLGLCAAAAGTIAGLALSFALVQLAGRTSLDVPLSYVAPDAVGVAGPLILGIVMALVAAAAPAWWAARVSPLAAMRPGAHVALRSRSGAVGAAAGLLLAMVGGLLLATAVATGRLLPGLAGGLLAFVGALCLTPIVVPAVIRVAGKARRLVPRRFRGGVPAELAVLDAARNPGRTAATSAALMVGVTLISMMSVGAASVSKTESEALDRVTPVDLTVAGASVTPAVVDAVRRADGVQEVEPSHGLTVRIGNRPVVVAALTSRATEAVVRDGWLRHELADPHTLVVPVSAQTEVPSGRERVRLQRGRAGVTLDVVYTSLDSGPLLVAPSVLARLGGRTSPVALYGRIGSGADPQAVVATVQRALAGSGGFSVEGGFAKRSTYDRTISVLLLVSTALLGVAVLIALVGVGNTLGLSVLERSREHGLLRALGLTTGQLRLMLAAEAVLVAGAGALLGLALGVGFGWAGTLTLLHGASNHAPLLAVPWGRLLVILLVALVAGALASVLPARRAVRGSPTSVLTAE